MNHFAPVCRTFYELGEKLSHGCSHHCLALRGIHAVSMQFDEQPVRPLFYGNRSFFPKFQPSQTGRVCSGERRILKPADAITSLPVKIEHERTLDIERENLGRTPNLQVAAFAVWRSCTEGKAALVQRVHFPDLCGMKCSCRQREIGIAPSVRQDLHFVIYAACISVYRVRQSKIAVHESISWLVGTLHEAQGTMIRNKNISKLFQ